MSEPSWQQILFSIAEGQLGYFTAAQAKAAGVRQVRLVQLAKSGDIERISRGVYRLTRYPISPLGQYAEATLWPQVRRPDVRGTLSHESALAFYHLSDVSPAKVHITLPVGFRVRRAVPRHIVLHYAELEDNDVRVVEGIPVTTPVRTIRDVHAEHLGAALVRQAIDDGRRNGELTYDEADRLSHGLLGADRRRARARFRR